MPINQRPIQDGDAPPEGDRRVIPFRPRTTQNPAKLPHSDTPTLPEDLSSYERNREPDDFSVTVPVEIQTGHGKVIRQLRTGSEPVPFSVPVTIANAKAVLDPTSSVLHR